MDRDGACLRALRGRSLGGLHGLDQRIQAARAVLPGLSAYIMYSSKYLKYVPVAGESGVQGQKWDELKRAELAETS